MYADHIIQTNNFYSAITDTYKWNCDLVQLNFQKSKCKNTKYLRGGGGGTEIGLCNIYSKGSIIFRSNFLN